MPTKADLSKSDLPSTPQTSAQAILVCVLLALTLAGVCFGQTPTEQQVFSLILQAKQYTAYGNLEKALDVARRALALAEILGPNNSSMIALAANNLAVVYKKTGQYQNAEAAYKRACQIFSGIPELIAGEGSCRDNLGNLYDEMGRFKESEIQHKAALSIFKKISPRSLDSATVLVNLGLLYEHEADYSQSINYLENARSMLQDLHLEKSTAYAVNLDNLGLAAREAGDYDRSEDLHKKAVSLLESASDPADLAFALNNLALLYEDKGDYIRAEPLRLRSLATIEKEFGNSNQAVARALANLARNLEYQGRFEQAEALEKQAVETLERLFPGLHPDVAIAWDNLGSLYSSGGKYNDAEFLFQKALGALEATLGENNIHVAVALANLGLLYQTQGEYTRAEPLLQRSLKIRVELLGPDHPELASAVENLAALYWAQGMLAKTLDLLTTSNRIREHNLGLILSVGPEAEKQVYAATMQGSTDATISFHRAAAPNNDAALRLAFLTVLQRKGRVLEALSEETDSLRKQYKGESNDLAAQLMDVRTHHAALVWRGPGKEDPNTYKAEIAALSAKEEALEDSVGQLSFDSRVQPSKIVSLNQVREALPPSGALVEIASYFPFQYPNKTRWGPRRYVVYVLRKDGEVGWADLGEAELIDGAVHDLRHALTLPESSEFHRSSLRIYELTIEPIEKYLSGMTKVFISPDGELNLIPFSALSDRKGKSLIDQYEFTYLSTGRDLLRPKRKLGPSALDLILADPDFDHADDERQGAQTSLPPDAKIETLTTLHFASLPGTATEAAKIKELLPAAQVLTREHATKSALQRSASPRILHIATHGFFLTDLESNDPPSARTIRGSQLVLNDVLTHPTEPHGNPLLRSGLALAGANDLSRGAAGGILTALEASSLNLSQTELVVLSACETGVGDVRNGDGIYGLRRALVLAGSRTQVMSLWRVDDLAAQDLMRDYYTRLVHHEPRSGALRSAQQDMRQTTGRQHPYYWAAFIVSGEEGPLESR